LTFQSTSDYGDTTGFLAVDETNELIVLSFRGSSSLDNWIADLDFIKTDVDLCDGCEAHKGFWKSWESVADAVTAQIDSALSTYSGYTLVITGHSLGAAVATLAGTALRNSGYTLELVSLFRQT
jgi:Predicted lipase